MLHTDYRPREFSEIVGNDSLVQQLEGMLKRDDCPHTFLFQGPRGCGKTTLARLCATELGCDDNEVIEMDIATAGGIDVAREMKTKIHFRPMFGDKKGYIMDEVHAGTTAFFNGLLKSLEEPPEHVYFFLCTTDPQKVLKTVRSRCAVFTVEQLTTSEIVSLLEDVLDDYRPDWAGNKTDLQKIAKVAEGVPREALVILDQVIDLDAKSIPDAVGSAQTQEAAIKDLCKALLDGDGWKQIAKILKNLKEEPETVRRAVLGYMNTVLLNSGDTVAATIIEEFSDPFYNTGKAGLSKAAFMCLD